MRQIKAALQGRTCPLIDVADVSNHSQEEIEKHTFTRGLAAYVLSYIADVPADVGAKAVTDGSGDNGLDAILYHDSQRVLYLVQSKWHEAGTSTLTVADATKFVRGVRDLLDGRWDRFSTKIQSRSAELDAALNDAATRIVLVPVHTGQEQLHADVQRCFDDYLADVNSPTELATVQVFGQGEVYRAISVGLDGAPITLEAVLYEWGQVRAPYMAVYGQISAADLGTWYSQHSVRLFAMFLGNTDANGGIVATLDQRPNEFWYFNNGVTALARKVTKKAIGGDTRDSGSFECEDLRIVNGAQTVGAISDAIAKHPEKVAHARVPLRIISLEGCPEDFDKLITRYNNTQNRIDRRDFVALDSEQARIRSELLLENIQYAFKSGEVVEDSTRGFDLVEGTVARACQEPDIELAVLAKREIGRLWEDIGKTPYRRLFNPSVTGPSLWRSVQVLRDVESGLQKFRQEEGRRRLLAVHGNRFIAHLVFSSLPPAIKDPANKYGVQQGTAVRKATEHVFEETWIAIEQHFSDAYLASLFKNAAKCTSLRVAVNQVP